MEDLVESILDYIRADYTDYAIMINGEWGSGKTYFWNNKIRNKIESMQVNGKKLTTIYMSLYGISNLEEISKKIFIETTQLMDKNLKKYMNYNEQTTIPEYAKTGLDMANFFGVTQNGDKIDYEKFFSTDDKVLCFDDLERANVDVIDILGYINNFVEHDHIKTIIICNEKELSTKLKSNNIEMKTFIATYLLDKEKKLFENNKPMVEKIQESNGMLCSIAELGVDSKFLKEEDKAGIHELPADAPVGEDAVKYMGWEDGVIDFELTANRGDLLSILGMAYEVGAIYDKEVKPIDLSHKNTGKLDFKLNIKTENCSLFLARKVENIHISESIPEIKEKLMASGIRPINNVVDISNYVMLETGQPLHFYDADKLRGMLEVRMAEKGEKLITLDKQERTLSSEDIVISDGTRAIGLAGVMGGLDTEITENTKNVIIESAIFDNVKIRKTSNKILRSEASNRFEKGLDPNRTYMAIERACNMLEKYADGTVIDGTEIYDKSNKEEKRIEITVKNICDILGTEISKEDILDVFRKLDFKAQLKEDKMIVIVPTRRMDISIKEDLIEEVGRIYGVDNIQGKTMILPVKKGTYDNVTREIRNKMVNLGLNETLSYSLVNPKESDMFTKHNKESIGILAPLTEERSYLRQSLVTSLYKIYEYNKSHSIQDIHLFEIAKTFYKESDKLVEENKLACLMTGEYFLGLQTKKVDFYIIKGIAEEVLDYLGYNGRYSFIADNSKISEDMHPGKSAIISVNNDTVGMIGRINPVICEDEVYVMEINLDKLLSKKVGKMKYKEISKFQSVKKDISILVDENIMAQDLQKAIKNSGGKLLQSVNVFDVYNGKGIPEGKKSIAFSVELGDSTKTLTDEEINAVMNKVTENLKAKFGAELRK